MENPRKVETDKILELLRETAQYIVSSKTIPDLDRKYLMISVERMVKNVERYRGDERDE